MEDCDCDLVLMILIALPGPTKPESKLPLCCNLVTVVHIAVRSG